MIFVLAAALGVVLAQSIVSRGGSALEGLFVGFTAVFAVNLLVNLPRTTAQPTPRPTPHHDRLLPVPPVPPPGAVLPYEPLPRMPITQ